MEKQFAAYHERYAKQSRSNDGFETPAGRAEFIKYDVMGVNEAIYAKFKNPPHGSEVVHGPLYQMDSKKGKFDVCLIELRDSRGNYYGDFLLPVGTGMRHLITGCKKTGEQAKDINGRFVRPVNVDDFVKIIFRGKEKSKETDFYTLRFDFCFMESMTATTSQPEPYAEPESEAATTEAAGKPAKGKKGDQEQTDDLPF